MFAHADLPRTMISARGKIEASGGFKPDVNPSFFGKHLQLHQFQPLAARIEFKWFPCGVARRFLGVMEGLKDERLILTEDAHPAILNPQKGP